MIFAMICLAASGERHSRADDKEAGAEVKEGGVDNKVWHSLRQLVPASHRLAGQVLKNSWETCRAAI